MWGGRNRKTVSSGKRKKKKKKKNRNSDKDRLFEGGKDKMESAGNAGKPLKDLENEIRGLRQSA